VLQEGAEILTRGITRSYGDISYFLEDEPKGGDVEEEKDGGGSEQLT